MFKTLETPFLKICCMANVAEAHAAIAAGASAIGVVGPMPSGAGIITLEAAREICRAMKGRAHCFLLSSAREAEDLIAEIDFTGADVLQIVDHVDEDVRLAIRAARPDVKIVQVVHMESEASVVWGLQAAHSADMLLLDSGSFAGPVKELGGTGRVHDWTLSRDLVTSAPVPCLLAGGIGAHNARVALTDVKPFGLDLCSSVRSADLLDQVKLDALQAAVFGSIKPTETSQPQTAPPV
jgi:phosphoribosylanthranilate isomerase